MKCITLVAAVASVLASNDGFNSHARAPSTNTFRSYLESTHNQEAGSALKWAVFSEASGVVASGDDDQTVWELLQKAQPHVQDHELLDETYDDSYDQDQAYLSDWKPPVKPIAITRVYPVLLALREAIAEALARSDNGGTGPSPPRFLRGN